MRITRTIFLVCCLLTYRHMLQAAPPQGYAIEWGWNTAADTPAGTVAPAKQVLSNAVAISTGRLHCLALKSDGTVIQWGGNFRGEASFDNTVLTTGESGSGNTVEIKNTTLILTNGVVKIHGHVLNDVVSIAAGDGFSLALKKDGTVVAWGLQEAIGTAPTFPDNNVEESPMQIDSVTGLPVQAKGDTIKKSFGVGIINDGTVVTRVDNKEPAPLSNVVAIAAASFSSVVVKDDGTVMEWDSAGSLPQNRQLSVVPGLTNVISVAIGEGYQRIRPVALKKDGTVANWGGESIYNDATPPAGLSNVVAIAVGSNHTLALKNDGTVIGWGFNNVGQATGIPTIELSKYFDWPSHDRRPSFKQCCVHCRRSRI